MSMSQEEIEALMSGAGDIAPQEEEEVQEEISEEEEPQEVPFEQEEDESQEESEVAEEPTTDSSDDGVQEQEAETQNSDESQDENLDNLDDILSGIDGIVDDGTDLESLDENKDGSSSDKKDDNNIENLIDQNQYPMPAKDENKVVNQLSQVADDSEEKASQIFDVLSFILDENAEIQNYNKGMGIFVEDQIKLLESLSVKFPNIAVFNENLDKAKKLLDASKQIDEKINGENNKIFEAMELMQYHDINRQKIERVMSVIKKLNSYLNGIFEDDSDKPDVQIAKHISGDSNEVVDADDIESLISEFSQK